VCRGDDGKPPCDPLWLAGCQTVAHGYCGSACVNCCAGGGEPEPYCPCNPHR
jgi:hypothetical protein